jgi:hypothetical protein
MTRAALRLVYAVAGRAIVSDRPIPALEALRADRKPDFAVRRSPVALPQEAARVFDGEARVGARERRVLCLATRSRDILQVSGAGAFAIPHGQAAIEVDPEPGAEEGAVVEALLGPALALALARLGVFVLHASAVVLAASDAPGVIGLLGDSGAGKSTLARLLVETGAGVALAADDLLAVAAGPVALPHFPQLKLDAAAMAAIAGLTPRYPLLGLYELAPAPAAAAVGSEVVRGASAAAILLGHVIAGRLFAEDLLSAQLDFVAGMVGRVPLRRLTVPRRMDVGAEVLRWLEAARTDTD